MEELVSKLRKTIIYVEGETDKKFLIDVLFNYFEGKVKIENFKEIVISLGGKDSLKSELDKNLENRFNADLQTNKNFVLIIFDADQEGLTKRFRKYKDILKHRNLEGDVFLFTDQQGEYGDLEDTIKSCFKFTFFAQCWDNMYDCIKKSEIENLKFPLKKEMVYSYNDLFLNHGSSTKSTRINYLDEKLWNLDFENNIYLKRLKEFLDRNLLS